MMESEGLRFDIPSTPGLDSATSAGSGMFSPPDSPSTSGKRMKMQGDQTVYGLQLGLLRKWEDEKKNQLLGTEHAMQEIAVAKVRGFLDAIGCVVKIQSWYRMLAPLQAHKARKRAQRRTRQIFFRALRLHWKSERLFRIQVFGKFFVGWREEARTSKKLKSLITQFFRICIQRLRLTPQACMAFFNPGEWSKAIAKEDMLKIRRLMLEKLFHGWVTETRDLRMVRYKASMILSRMVRRTKGPLWVKEATLVCFHMWFRYIQVKKAYRLDLPDPRYTNPMLPQWTKLMKEITVSRIKRKRTAEMGAHLTRLRAFKGWKRLMVVDRTKPVTPLAVAIIHYSTVLMNKVLHAWHDIIRERGKIMRFRNKLFQNWRRWAPKHKQMRYFNDKAEELIRLKQVQRAYGVMVKLCFNVIGTRTEKIKELRRNFCDRRVVICAYALLHKDSHVMMVDCWRRLYFYWKSRRNWKSVAWHYTYEWHAHKMKVIFAAWKSLIRPTSTPALSTARANSKHFAYVTETDEGESTNEPTPAVGLSRENSLDSFGSLNSDEFNTNNPFGKPSASRPATSGDGVSSGPSSNAGSRPVSPPQGPGQLARRRQSSLRGKVMFNNPYSPNKVAASKVPNYEGLVRDFVPKALGIIQKGVEGRLSTKLTGLQFRTFCHALSRSYSQLANRLSRSLNGGVAASRSLTSSAPASLAQGSLEEGSMAASEAGDGHPRRPTINHLTTASVVSESTARNIGTAEKSDYDVACSKELHFPVYQYFNRALQDRLQTAIDQVDMEGVLDAVSEGAVIETQHMKQIGIHIGDMYMPLFTLLLTNSAQFFADRVTKQDSMQVLLDIQNPVNAYLAGTQIDRWNRGEVTYRESMQLTQDLPTQRYISGEFSSYYLMRLIILKNIDLKAKRLLHLCVMLPEHRTVEQEVPEVLKRQKLAKLYRLRKSLTEMIGGDDTFQDTYLAAMGSIPPLVKPAPSPSATPYANPGDTAGKDIYTVLREFTLLTGKLTTEARSLRAPLMERDQRLIENGFLRQARADFLALRQECLTDKQKAAIAEKQRKADEKERKIAEKQKKAERKKRDKRLNSGKKKGGKKSRTASLDMSFDQLDTDATSGDEGYASDGAGDGSHLSELCRLSFLEGGLDIGEEADIQHDADFMQRTAHFRHTVFLEVYQRCGWREKKEVRQAIQHGMISAMRSTIRRVMDVLQADKTIGKVDYAMARSQAAGLGPYIVNHVLSAVACRRSATWYVLPKDYWSFRVVRERVNIEIAVTDATVSAIKSRLNVNHHQNHAITNDISSYQKFLKQTRKEILKIAEKRASKSGADTQERAPFVANIKRCDTKIKGAEKAIEVIKDKLRRAEVQIAAGNMTGAAEVFVPPEEPTEATKKSKKGKGGKDAEPAKTYDAKTVYGMVDAGNQELARLDEIVAEQRLAKKECENQVRMYDWQCQRTSQMLRDLAEGRFQTMIDVQLVAVREAKRLEDTEDVADTQSTRYKAMKRYFRALTDFLEGPIADRGQQIAKETEQRRVSEILKGNSGRAEFANPSAALAAANAAASKKRGTLSSTEEAGASFRSMGSRAPSEVDFGERLSTLDGFGVVSADDEEERSLGDSVFSDGDSTVAMEERRRHEAALSSTVEGDKEVEETEQGAQDTRTSSQIAVDAEIELAHHNSHENRMKREAALKLLAEEQARENATQDLRIRVFEEYWNALPQNAERVQNRRKSVVEVKAPVQEEVSEVSSVAEASSVYLNRSDRIWKAIGTQYWRTKEEQVRTLLQNGEDVSDVRKRFMKDIDPLDEDLNELPTPKKPFVGSMDDSDPENDHLDRVPEFENAMNLWGATPQAEHVKMMSVSMKELHAVDHDSLDGGGGHSVDGGGSVETGEASSQGSLRGTMIRQASRQPSANLSRQTSQITPVLSRSMSRQPSNAGRLARQPSKEGEHGHTGLPPRIGRGGAVKPDPFALVGRDEHARFIDHRRPVITHDSLATGSSEESELFHLELGHLTHAHLPTLQEGDRGGEVDGVGGSGGFGEYGADGMEGEFETFSSAGGSSAASSVRHPHNMQAYLERMGFSSSTDAAGNSVGVPVNTRASTFEQFDRIFDKLADTIVGALETAFSNSEEGSLAEPSVVASISMDAADDVRHPSVQPTATPGHGDHDHDFHHTPHEDGHGVLHGEEVVTASAKLLAAARADVEAGVIDMSDASPGLLAAMELESLSEHAPLQEQESDARLTAVTEETSSKLGTDSGTDTRPVSSKRSSRPSTRPTSSTGGRKTIAAGTKAPSKPSTPTKSQRNSITGADLKSPLESKTSSFVDTPTDIPSPSVAKKNSFSSTPSAEKRHTVVGASATKAAKSANASGDSRSSTPSKSDAAPTSGAKATPARRGSGGAEQSTEQPHSGKRAQTQFPVRTPSLPVVTVTSSPAGSHKTAAKASVSPAQAIPSAEIIFTDTLTTAADNAAVVAGSVEVTQSQPVPATGLVKPQPITIPAEGLTLDRDAVSAIEEGSVEDTEVSPTPSRAEARASRRQSRALSRAKMQFSDELMPSPRDLGEEDSVNSDMSPQVFADEFGNPTLYGTDGRPITRNHKEYEKMRLQQKLLGLAGQAETPNSWSRSMTPLDNLSAQHSPRTAGSQSSQPGGRGKRSDSFMDSAHTVTRNMMENISNEVSMELEPPYEEQVIPERYLPEREMREAIFGGAIDTGAAGLVSFLQTFAKPAEAPKRKVKKEEVDPNAGKGFVAVPVGGEWKLLPSPKGPPTRLYSPKMRPQSPGDSSTKGSPFSVVPVKAPAPSPQAPPSLLVEGSAVGSTKRVDVLQLQVPMLSPHDHRRLAQKLGLDPHQQQALESAAAAGVPAVDAAELDQNLLGLVQEFYVEKTLEEERLERMQQRATTSYFPPSFRQSKDLSHDSQMGSGSYRADLFGPDDQSDYSGNDAFPYPPLVHHASDGLPTSPGKISHLSSGFELDLSPTHSNKHSRRPSQHAGADSAQYSSQDILAAVAAVARSGADKQAPGAVQGQGANAQGGAAPAVAASATPTRRLSLKMEQMLSRRNSYNPTEVRLELLKSIHSPEHGSGLDGEVDSAVREVRKYLKERQDEMNAVHPKGKLRTKESLARSVREAEQRRADPYKVLSAQRAAQVQAEQEALMQQQFQRRPSPPHSPSGVQKQRPFEVAVGATEHWEQRDWDAPLVSDRRDSRENLNLHDFPAGNLEHPSRVQSAAVHYSPSRKHFEGEGSPERDGEMKRVGTPEFWVNVTTHKPVPVNVESAELPAVIAAAKARQTDIPDDHSSVSSEGSISSSVNRNRRQILMLDRTDGVDYQDTSVLGFNRDDRDILVHYSSQVHLGQAAHQIELAVNAVKLNHPVSAAVDKKAEGQYSLYRERTPMRSNRRSPSPPNRGQKDAAPNAGKKGMVYSHSDGLLMGANAMITGSKVKFSATTSRVPHQSAVDDTRDDGSTGGDTINSTLSPIMFNLQPKAVTPPYMGSPKSYSLDSSRSQHVNYFAESKPGTPGGELIGAHEAEAASRRRRDRTPPGRARSYSKDIEISNPSSSRSEMASDSAAALFGPPIRVMSGSDQAMPGSSQSQRDYRTSASAARIISEIAGDNYYYSGLGTGNNSVTGTTGNASLAGEDVQVLPIYAGGALEDADLPGHGSLTLSPSPSRSSRKALNITNYEFSPGAGPLPIDMGHSSSRPPSPQGGSAVLPGSVNSAKSAGDPAPSIVVPLRLPKEPTVPSNIITTTARRAQEAAMGLELLIVPQNMPTFAKINDRSQKLHREQALASNKSQRHGGKPTAARRTPGGTELPPAQNADNDTDSIPSYDTPINIPVPVSRVEFKANMSTDQVLQLGSTPFAGQVPFEIDTDSLVDEPGLDAEMQARLEAQMEEEIERELRQMLVLQHQEDDAEAYRQAYYKQNKEYLEQAGVASHDPRAQVAGGANPLPFNAGGRDSRKNNPDIAARVGETSVSDRIRLSASVGGGGFAGRTGSVLHKVKGHQVHSLSTTQLPPLEPSFTINPDKSYAPTTPGGSRRGKTQSRRSGQRETHNMVEALLASSDQLVHNKLKLAALLHNATGGAEPGADPATSGKQTAPLLMSTSAKVAEEAAAAKRAIQAKSRPAPTRQSVGLFDVAQTVTAGIHEAHVSAQLGDQLHSLSQASLSSTSAAPLVRVLSGRRDNARRDSVESMNSAGSGPLQSILAPAVAVTHNANPSAKIAARKSVKIAK